MASIQPSGTEVSPVISESLRKNLLTHHPEKELSVKAKAFLARPKRLYINGQFVDAAARETFETEDPALGTAITEVASAKKEDVEQAASAARDAFEKRWSTLAPAQRGAYLFKLADLILENMEELGHLEALDTGKPVKNATGEIRFAAETYRYYAGWATKLSGRSFDLSLQANPYHCVSLRQPVGVVGGIVAWNFPFVLASWKVAPALAAGCTMILKPAEQTPLTALRLAELCDEAGLPPRVLNVLTGIYAIHLSTFGSRFCSMRLISVLKVSFSQRHRSSSTSTIFPSARP